MKFILSITLFIFTSFNGLQSYAQGINFQGVARSSNGTIISSSNISLRLSIISKNVDATPEYVETKTVVTNPQGIFSVVVGDAANATVVGNFKNIAWSEGIKFLKVEMDPAAGSNFINMGATQLQYVPYAFYSLGVDANNISGTLSVEKGGTGVKSLEQFKASLDLYKLGSDSVSIVNNLHVGKDLIVDGYINGIKKTNIKYGENFGDTIVLKDDVDIYETVDGSWHRNVKLPIPQTLNNNLYKRINTTLLINCRSSFSFAINKSNTSLTEDLILYTGEYAIFLFDKYKWVHIGGKTPFSNMFSSSFSDAKYNLVVGKNNLKSNVNGTNNIIFGNNSIYKGINAFDNIALGNNALYSSENGYFNIAIGTNALFNFKYLVANTAIGYGSQNATINGGGNSSLGYLSLSNNLEFYNSAFGHESMRRNTTGTSNTAIGAGSLSNNTIGSNHTAIGGFSMELGTTGFQNTAIGSNSLRKNTTGSRNVAIGYNSLSDGNLNDELVAIGANSLTKNLNGVQNTAIGTNSMSSNTIGSYNNAIGYLALNSNLTGDYNIAIGNNTLLSNTSGVSNLALGNNALKSNLTGSENIAIGYNALSSITNAKRSIALGVYAMQYYNNTTTDYIASNIAIGYRALRGGNNPSINIGSNNIAIGTDVMINNNSGNQNIAFGSQTLHQNRTGSDNIAIGQQSLFNNTNGIQNVAIGLNALGRNEENNGSTAIGYNSMYNASRNSPGISSGNTAVGFESLKGSDDNYGVDNNSTNNTAVGFQSLLNVKTASNNVAVGNSSASTLTSGSNNIVIGSNAQTSTTIISNEITLGNTDIITLRAATSTITSLSDRRDKKNINDLNIGLEFINTLKPRSFNWDKREWYKDGVSDGSKISKVQTAGFIAQELEEAQNKYNAEWLKLVYKSNPNKMEATYGNLLPVVVKSIQELSDENSDLKLRVRRLEELVQRLILNKPNN